jgi:hypothetical protein
VPGPPLDNGLDWYVAPIFELTEDTSDPDPENHVYWYRGVGSGGSAYEPKHRMVLHAYDVPNSEVLVGVPVGTVVPGDWVAQTIGQATSFFTTVKGRAPTAREIR